MSALKLPGLRCRNPDRPTMKERIRAAATTTARIFHFPHRPEAAETSTPAAAVAPGLPDPDAALLALAPELERRCAECPRLWVVKWEDDTMTNTAAETRSVVEREIPFPPEKI